MQKIILLKQIRKCVKIGKIYENKTKTWKNVAEKPAENLDDNSI